MKNYPDWLAESKEPLKKHFFEELASKVMSLTDHLEKPWSVSLRNPGFWGFDSAAELENVFEKDDDALWDKHYEKFDGDVFYVDFEVVRRDGKRPTKKEKNYFFYIILDLDNYFDSDARKKTDTLVMKSSDELAEHLDSFKIKLRSDTVPELTAKYFPRHGVAKKFGI